VLLVIARDPGGAPVRPLAAASEAGTGAAVLTALPEAAPGPRPKAAEIAASAPVDPGSAGNPPQQGSTSAVESGPAPISAPTQAAALPMNVAKPAATSPSKPSGDTAPRPPSPPSPPSKPGASPPVTAAPGAVSAPKREGSALDRWD
jgi:hypothetical protein